MTVPDPAGVLITSKDLYDKLVDVEKAVNLMTPQANQLVDHESRIRALEKWKWSIPPTFAAAAIAIVEQLVNTRGR